MEAVMLLIDQGVNQPTSNIGWGCGHVGTRPMKSHETLEKVELFRSLDAKERMAMEHRCIWRHVQAKQWLLEHNDVGTEVYFLTSGAVRVVTMPSPNCDVILDDIQAGNHFGEMAAIDGLPRSAAILAMTDSTIACMSAAVFREFLYRYPTVSEQLLKQFVTRIRALDQRVNEFSSMHVKNRIYAELLRRARPDPTNSRQGIVSPPPIHADIAGRVSTRREMVARELKILERAGLLVKRRGAFVLTNVPKLVDKIHQDTNDEVQTRRDSFHRPVRIEAAELLAV
jgi:CRP/FNR family cyclic AMP-dependent transcriptional regulator